MVKRKGKASPKHGSSSVVTVGTGQNNSSATPTTPSSNGSGVAAATTTTNISHIGSDHEDIKVETFDELIRSDVEAMMMMMMMSADGSAKTATATTGTDATVTPVPAAPKWIGSIDQGTSSTRFMIFNNRGQIVASAQMEHTQMYPQPSWHEHDPIQIWKNTMSCMTAVARKIQVVLSKQQNDFLFHPSTTAPATESTTIVGDEEPSTTTDTTTQRTLLVPTNRFLSAIGVTNQRETIVCWNRSTGRPYYNAIVWDDARTANIVEEIIAGTTTEQVQYITQTTGLPISTYFAATKMKWLLNNVEQIRYDIQNQNDQVCFGTIDTWLLYQLTGQIPKSEVTKRPLKGNAGLCNTGGIFKTDVTNASRWLLMKLQNCQWDEQCISTIMCHASYEPYISIQHNLPEICPSSYYFGTVNVHCGIPSTMYGNIPITGILGDQQSALFGQAAHTKGCAKNTYGTGLFLMMNTGPDVVPPNSTHGLLTTVAYRIGVDGPIYYAYEGSVSHSGSTIQWLRDQIGIINNAAESETLARTTSSNDGLYMVPAFGGLLAPHWRNDARGCIVGITALHHKGHICRAALEATAYQTKDVFDAIIQDSNITLSSLNVDGGGTYNKLLMQFQADILNVKVIRPKIMETTSIGVAFAAGLTIGIWKDVTEIQQLWSIDTVYEPQMSDATRTKYISGWKKALSKSFNWTTSGTENTSETTKGNKAESNEATNSSTFKDNDLGSSWTVVPSSRVIPSPVDTTPVEQNKDVNGTEKKMEVVSGVVESAVVDVGSSSGQKDELLLHASRDVSTCVAENSPVQYTFEDISTKSKPITDDIDGSTNASTHSETSGTNWLTLVMAIGMAFTAGILVPRKR